MNAQGVSSVVSISKLLTARNVEFIDEPGKLKCQHCKSILYNPCRLSCSCKYCHQCIDELVASGTQFCPGNSENCQSANLAQFIFDCKTSSKVLKLQVKCPEQLCSQECQLIELEDHLKKCTKKSINCPFSDMGCEMEKMAEEKLKVHFEAEICNHNRMLIEMIDNLKNEISCLKKELVFKDDHIELVSAGVQQARQAHDSMHKEMNAMKAEFQSLSSDNVATKADIESIKIKVKRDIMQHFGKIIVEMKTQWQQTTQERDDKDEEMAKAIKEVKDQLATFDASMLVLNESVNKHSNADFLWFCDSHTESQTTEHNDKYYVPYVSYDTYGRQTPRQTVQTDITLRYSDSFPGTPSPYKFRLAMQNHVNDHLLVVQLQIQTGQSDATLTWPFRGKVTINIFERSRPKICKSASRHCQIKKPTLMTCSSSDKFIFDYADWNKAGIVIGNGLVVSCSVVKD